MGQRDGDAAFEAINDAFQWLSPAAIIEHSILCVHGGIGRIKWLRQIDQLVKPCAGVQDLINSKDARGRLLTDILWSDPTNGPGKEEPAGTPLDGGDGAVSTRGNQAADAPSLTTAVPRQDRAATPEREQPIHAGVGRDGLIYSEESAAESFDPGQEKAEGGHTSSATDSDWQEDEQGLLTGPGIGANSRGEGICTFDESVVRGFLSRNRLRCIIRAHEVTMDGFDLHSDGHLVTLFSATNYCGVCKNNGAVIEATWGDACSSAGYTNDRATLVLQAKLISAAVEHDARATWVMGRGAAPPTPPRDANAKPRLQRQNTQMAPPPDPRRLPADDKPP